MQPPCPDTAEALREIWDTPPDECLSLGAGIRQFAEYQPFTPIIETLRGLLTSTPSADDAIATLAWCFGIAIVGYLWAVATFRKRV